MPKIQYIERDFKPASLAIITIANKIIRDYMAQGFRLTLRQLYYQFVSRDLIQNTQREYSRLGSIINDGRLAGLIDWSAIEDRTRNLEDNTHWDSPEEIIRSCVTSYQIDKWDRQDYRPEVWIEKEALAGVIEPVCRELDIPFLCCRGYTSQSEMWNGGRRLLLHASASQTPYIIHLGDHDPSGIDMTRDITDRLRLFMGGCEVNRIALNMDQVEEYSPPPNPAKVTDSRATAYIARFGGESWELDALEPAMISDLIRKTVEAIRDNGSWDEALAEEDDARDRLRMVAERWKELTDGRKPRRAPRKKK